ncbi:MAG: hypothetical protein GY835_15085 [bacterium]|nr:hypothetical protein [bacterium]
MYKISLICDADSGVLATLEDAHPANELAYRAWRHWRDEGSSSAAFENIDMDVVDDYIQSQNVDPYFLDFHDFIMERKILFGVVSQRMGRIVETILRRKGLTHIPVFANGLEIEPFTIRLRFPHFNKLGCDYCPNCTLYHVKRFRRPDIPLVFVGEKSHDLCAARAADLVFARGELVQACNDHEVPYEQINNLRDVERILMRMMMKDQLKDIVLKNNDDILPIPPENREY